jgi:hypothetical protein
LPFASVTNFLLSVTPKLSDRPAIKFDSREGNAPTYLKSHPIDD